VRGTMDDSVTVSRLDTRSTGECVAVILDNLEQEVEG
jgi:hypothetical protein